MKTTVISSQRQVTLPKKMMEKVNMSPKSNISLEIVNGGIFIKARNISVVDELSGCLRDKIDPKLLDVPWEEVIEGTYNKLAEEIAREGISD